MEAPEVSKPQAWLPLTPRGVAAFSSASCGRLLLFQALVAVFAAAILVWSLRTAWFPAFETAIGNLPDAGDIRVGLLDWRGPETATLAETHFLAFTVNLSGRDQPRTTSHLQVELRPRTFRIDSLLGTTEQIYPGRSITPLNRPELQARWSAWQLPASALVGIAVVVSLFICWFLLATIYCLPAWLGACFASRDLTLAGSWKLCSAGLLPGALFLCAGIWAYGAGTFDLVKLTLVFAMHFIISWLSIAAAIWALQRNPKAGSPRANPFQQTAK